MESENAIVVSNQYNVVSTPEQIRANVNLIQQVMQKVMHKGTHFDTVPGCGPKPTLLKPGAEKLCSTFLLAPDPVIEDLSTPDERRYRIKCRLIHSPSGTFMGSGIGECSSNEEKYKWRKAVTTKEYDATSEDRRRIKYTYNDEIKQIRVNIADIANTVLKMAKKRALVDGVLTVTGASDMFTQDIEDMEFEPKASAPISAPPQRRSAQEPTSDELKAISERKAAEYAASKEVPNNDTKTAQKSTPPQDNVDKVLVAKGKVIAHYPPKGKGPHSFKVDGFDDYLKTFDEMIAETLVEHKVAGDVIEVNYETVTKGEYSNNMITGITVTA